MNDNLKTLIDLRISLDTASDMCGEVYSFLDDLLSDYQAKCDEVGDVIDFENLIMKIDSVVTELDLAMFLIKQLKKQISLKEAVNLFNKYGDDRCLG